MFTLEDLKENLKRLDEVTLLELLELTSDDIVERCADLIEDRFNTLEIEFDEHTSWDND
jgi:hypothetical protein